MMVMADGSTSSTSEPNFSDSEKEVVSGRGRGRGRGRQSRGQCVAKTNKKQNQKASCQNTVASGQNTIARMQLLSEGESVETSDTDETKRIQGAMSRQAGRLKRKACSSTSSGPEGSSDHYSLIEFANHIVNNILSEEDIDQLHKIQDAVTLGELSAGMGTGTIVAAVLERALESKGLKVNLDTAFFTESVSWKRQLCHDIYKHVQGEHHTIELFGKTAELANQRPPMQCDICVSAIECDDISMCSGTPKSVLDRSGKSGASFCEFVDFLRNLPFQQRPKFLVVECVASLGKMRRSVNEKGTTAVSQTLRELGFTGEWRTLNTRKFGLPQSRTRVYGVFVLMTIGFGSSGEQTHKGQLNKIWSFCDRCQIQMPESLHSLLLRSDLLAQSEKNDERDTQKKSKGKKGKKGTKWKEEHKKFRVNNGLVDDQLDWHPALKALQQQQQQLNLTERELDASLLALATALKRKGASTSCFSMPVGDSLHFMKVSTTCHPCLLPQKKYLYIVENKCYVSGKAAILPLMLQGLGPNEINLAGPAVQALTASQAQDLAGNAFTSNIVLAIMLGVLLHYGQ